MAGRRGLAVHTTVACTRRRMFVHMLRNPVAMLHVAMLQCCMLHGVCCMLQGVCCQRHGRVTATHAARCMLCCMPRVACRTMHAACRASLHLCRFGGMDSALTDGSRLKYPEPVNGWLISRTDTCDHCQTVGVTIECFRYRLSLICMLAPFSHRCGPWFGLLTLVPRVPIRCLQCPSHGLPPHALSNAS